MENIPQQILLNMTQELQNEHARIAEAADVSRNGAREAYTAIFALQRALSMEDTYQSLAVEALDSIVGVGVMQGLVDQLNEDPKNECPTSIDISDARFIEGNSTASTSTTPSYHVVGTSLAGIDTATSHEKRISEYPEDSHAPCKKPRLTTSAIQSNGILRHAAVLDYSSELEASRRSQRLRKRHSLLSEHTHNNQSESDFQPHKRPRLAEYSPTSLLKYTSDNETDDTYTDSDGTERDFEDDAYSFFDSRGYSPRVELSEESELSSETDDSQAGIRWGSIPSFDNDPGDTDYQPPDWDMEDIWELEAPWRNRYHPLFTFEYSNELRQCQGVMSDASLSTDDPDKGYNDLGKLRLKTLRFSLSLGRMLSLPIWDDDDNYRVIGNEEVVLATEIAIERYREKSWRRIERMVENGFYPVDFEERLADLLKSDHLEFFFEDEIWRKFEPHPVSSRRAEPPSPKVLSFMESVARGLLDRWE